MEEQNKVLPKEAVVKSLETSIDETLHELEHVLIPELKHGEAKRLLVAVLKYPKVEADFSSDNTNLIRAYSLSKNVKDNLIGIATEVVIERLIKSQMEEKTEATEEGGDNV